MNPAILIAATITAGLPNTGTAITATTTPPIPPVEVADRLRRQLRLARAEARAERRARVNLRRRYRAVLRTHPDVRVAATLAGLAYGQDPAALIRCARSEGLPKTGSHDQAREVHIENTAGSGAAGPWQFMPSTFATTPQGRAGLSIWRIDVSAFATAWMWSQGRRGEWAGAGC